MKVGKKMLKVEITNPFRPPTPFKRKYTVCRVTEGNTISVDPDVYKIQVDYDECEKFAQKLSTIKNPYKYYCTVLEMFFTTEKYLEKILKWATEFFDEVHFEKLDNTVEKIKTINEKTKVDSTGRK